MKQPARLACCLLLLAPVARAAAAANPLGPGSGPWVEEAPDKHGLDKSTLHRVQEHIGQNMKQRSCFVVIKGGALVHEWYFHPFVDGGTPNIAHSMTKTLGALVAGWAATHGGLDIDADITATYGVPSPKSYAVTSRQIMSQALAGQNGPGEAWAYDALGSMWINKMPQVVQAASGKKPSDIWRENFVEPLGLNPYFDFSRVDYDWADGSQGSCTDYARIGQLMLNGGAWKGVAEPIVSSEYIKAMGTPQRFGDYKNYTNPCYGLLTWVNGVPGSDSGSAEYPGVCQFWPEAGYFPAGSPSDVFFASGVMGQITMVIPGHDMVLVSMGNSPDDFALQRLMYEGVCMIYPDDCKGGAKGAPQFV